MIHQVRGSNQQFLVIPNYSGQLFSLVSLWGSRCRVIYDDLVHFLLMFVLMLLY